MRNPTTVSAKCYVSDMLVLPKFWVHIVLASSIVFILAAGGAVAFDCVETKCPDISSCAEAAYKLEVCGHLKRDADSDGIPCESLCGHDLQIYRQRVHAMWPEGLKRDPTLAEHETPSTKPTTANALIHEQGGGGAPSFTCAGKRTCSQMISCAEARFYLTQCGLQRLDGDGDGIPCNALCRQR